MFATSLLLGALTLVAAGETPVAASTPEVVSSEELVVAQRGGRDRRSQEEEQAPAETPAVAETDDKAAPVAEVEQPAEVEASAPATASDRPLTFNFRHAPWKEVLPWFADKADLSLEMASPPTGTLNYIDGRHYSIVDGMDILNELLQIKGYTLIKRDRLLMLINLEDGIPPNLVPTVPIEELDQRGKHEIVSVLFKMERLKPDEVEGEIKKLLGPQGTVVLLPSAQQLMVTDSVWRLRTVRDVVDSIQNPNSADSGPIAVFETKYVSPLEAISMIRQLMDFPDDKNVTADGGLRIAIDPISGKLLASGRSDLIKRVRAILETIDAAPAGVSDGGPTTIEMPQVQVYSVGGCDPNTALSVLQTLFADSTDMNLALDPLTGSLVARAKPSQHATIRATIDELSGESKQIEVFRLAKLDPPVAVLAINKLFMATGENASSNAPKVDADPNTRQLIVRGTKSQISDIRKMLEDMGEVQSADGIVKSNDRMRMLPLTGRAQRVALEQLQQIWPTLRGNQIRVVTPSALAPTVRGLNPPPGIERTPTSPNNRRTPPIPSPPAAERTTESEEDRTSARATHSSPFQLVAQQTQAEAEDHSPTAEQPSEAPPTPDATAESPSDAAATPDVVQNSPIIISAGPGGLMIASDDTEALDAMESMLNTLAQGGTTSTGREYTVYYLQNASATVAAQTLASILGGATSSGNEGSLMGDLASSAFGDMGGMMANMMGMGGGGGGGGGGDGQVTRVAGGTMIVPDMRLNALFVQATPANLESIEQLLQVIDQPETPETQIAPRPRIIQLYATDATEVANIVKAVYQEQTSAGSGQRQPSPQEFMEAMMRGGRGGGRGGRGGGGGGGGNSAQEVQKMSIGVDTRNNCIIVSAPQPLFEEVEVLIQTLDQAEPTSPEITSVVKLKRANTEAVQQTVARMVGQTPQSGNRNNSQRNGGGNQQNQGFQPGQGFMRQFGQGGFGPGGFGQGGFGQGGFGQGGQGGGRGQGGGGGRGNGGGGGGGRGR